MPKYPKAMVNDAHDTVSQHLMNIIRYPKSDMAYGELVGLCSFAQVWGILTPEDAQRYLSAGIAALHKRRYMTRRWRK